jgi:hypothetical protein
VESQNKKGHLRTQLVTSEQKLEISEYFESGYQGDSHEFAGVADVFFVA